MKKKLLALLLALALVVCTLPAPASAYYDKGQTVQLTAISKPAQRLKFKDNKGNAYYVESGTLVSSGSSYTGYIFVIQEVLERLSAKTGNTNLDPQGVDGIFGNNTRLAVVCFQVKYIGADAGDGVVGPTTWWYLHQKWSYPLLKPKLTNVVQ